MLCRRFIIALAILVCFGITAGAFAAAEEQPKSKIYTGMVFKNTPAGVTITIVKPNSPAGKAGLLPGDIIVSVQGMPVNNSLDLEGKVFTQLLPYQPASFLLLRGGAKIEKSVEPSGVVRLEVNDAAAKFVVPGVPAERSPGPKNAVEAMDKINVLQQVLFDRKTGAIELVGSYDSQFPTGPIPYLDLLKTALAFSLPEFSLEPAFSVEEYAKIPPPAFSAEGMYTLLFGHPALESDRQLLIRLSAKQYGIRPEEYAMLNNYFVLDDKGGAVPPTIVSIQANVFKNMGYEEAAQAWSAFAGSATPDAAAQALRILGKEPGTDPGSLRVQALFALIDNIGNKSGGFVAYAKAVEQGRAKETNLVVAMHKALMPEWDKTGQRNALIDLFQELTLSNAATHLLAQYPAAFAIKLVPKDLDPTSQLHRILYEADYSLKGVTAVPASFREVSGFMTPEKWRESILRAEPVSNFYSQVRFWFEPRKVDMQFSEDKTVVSFGTAEMNLFNAVQRELLPNGQEGGNLTPVAGWDKYCQDFIAHYDQYAHILPSLHELREAAKVLALSRWINAEQIPVLLAGVAQEKWNPPSEVAGLWMISFKVRSPQPGERTIDAIKPMRVLAGGVNFKAKSNWTSYTPMPTGETKVSGQLALSSQLGQKAAQAAISGSLENARYLSELSAQAMTGGVTKNDLSKMNIPVPEVRVAAVSPASVQLQKEMVSKTHQQITALTQSPAANKSAATNTLNQINYFYDQVRSNPAAASDYLNRLQTGQLSSTPPPHQPAAPQQMQVAVKPPVESVCSEGSLDSPALSAERRAYLTQKLGEARERLQYINTALKKLISINAKERSELEKWTVDIDKAYDKCLDRTWEAVNDLLLDAAPEALQKNYSDALGTVDAVKSTWLKEAMGEADPRKLAELTKGIESLDSLKTMLDDSHRLIKVYQDTKTFYDVDKGNMESRNASEQLKNASAVIAQLILSREAVEKALDSRLFKLTGKSLAFFKSLYTVGKATTYAWGFLGDIMRQQFAWKPLMEQLQKDLEFNGQAMEKLRLDAAQTSLSISCMEKLLR